MTGETAITARDFVRVLRVRLVRGKYAAPQDRRLAACAACALGALAVRQLTSK